VQQKIKFDCGRTFLKKKELSKELKIRQKEFFFDKEEKNKEKFCTVKRMEKSYIKECVNDTQTSSYFLLS
jgi:hypothetical protein